MSKKSRRNRNKKKQGPTLPKAKPIGTIGSEHQQEAVLYQNRIDPALLQAQQIKPIPRIIGADFDPTNQSIEHFQKLVDAAPKRGQKTRILITNEASFLFTGFSIYGNEVFKRLHATGKYELAEIGSYAGGDPDSIAQAEKVPWKFYPVMPKNMVENDEFQSDTANQFGKWKLGIVLSEFKPDIVICIRDWWMDEHVLKHPLRGKYHVIWMATVDGYPQRWEWMRDYQNVDTILAYSYFGKRVLEEQSSWDLARRKGIEKKINVSLVTQPGTDLTVFKPLPEGEAKKKFNIPTDVRFCGTVMRNQPRKLYPRIIEGFARFKKKYPHEAFNAALLLHTSIPDVGWDRGKGILETIERQGIGQFVFFSYICHKCKHMGIHTWSGSPAPCPRCGRNEYRPPNTRIGYPPEAFNVVFNLMDVYIQGSIAEGDGMPINEAKAAGVPVLVSNYSAMYEKARNGGGMWIENESLFNEPSDGCKKCGYTSNTTMQHRSHFSRKDMAKKLALLFGDETLRKKLGHEARECASKYHDWNLTSKKWEYILDTVELKDRKKTWDMPESQIIRVPTDESAPPDLDNDQWLLWCYQNILNRTEKDKGGNEIMLEDGTPMPVQKVDNDGRRTWVSHLEKGTPRSELEKHFRSLVKENKKVAEIIQDPGRAAKDPMQRVAEEVAEAEKE